MGITFDRNTKNVELANCEIGYIGAQGISLNHLNHITEAVPS